MSGGAGMNSIIGSGFDMPISYLLKKQEETGMYTPESLMDDHFRKTLKDRRPDPEFLASDTPVGGRDVNGELMGNPYSNRVLTLRDTGKLSRATPDLPDGTFLDHQFLEQDPRGSALGPNMRRHAEQQFARAKLINFYDDSDKSVPESGINPYQMNAQIRGAQNRTKDYFKIFETSRDGWHNGGIGQTKSVSNLDKFSPSTEMKDPVHAPNRNRTDATHNMSNDTSIGWRRTTDNRFEVSKYGKKNNGKSFTDENWYKNRANAHVDHDILQVYQGQNVTKTTALMMMDLAKKKTTAHWTGMHGIEYNDSNKSANKKYKLGIVDMAGMAKRPGLNTQDASAHSKLKGDQKTTSGGKLLLHDAPTINKTKIHTTVFEKMGRVNKQTTKEQKNDLRNEIKQGAKTNYLHNTVGNRKGAEKVNDPGILWDSIAVYDKGVSKTIVNYRTSTKSQKGNNLQKLADVKFKDNSKTTCQRKGRMDIETVAKHHISRIDNDFGRDDDHVKLVGPLGSKKMRGYMEHDEKKNDINDR
jgi:hypothetical protein